MNINKILIEKYDNKLPYGHRDKIETKYLMSD